MDDSFQYGKWMSHPPPGEEVVVTGVSGRFPESNNVLEFQENLFNKRDLVTDDDRRWKLENVEIPQRIGKIYNIDKLDAGYFKMHHRQAEALNPLTRKTLETVIEAILDAGVNPSELEGSKTGVFVGVYCSDSEMALTRSTEPQCFGITSCLKSFTSDHVSYFLKLKGPCYNVDTACSSSFYALNEAFRSMREGRCENAIVGAANLVLHPIVSRSMLRIGALSPEGTGRAFDEQANGYARSESVACIFLQKAKNARRTYAQVIHTKSNSDGFKSLGITFPISEMQKQLISETLEESGVDPSNISFIEAHCTGTSVGISPEVEAIDCAIAQKRDRRLLIGSHKSNMGHSEAASGLCALVKMIIAMETEYIAPNIHLNKLKKGVRGFEEGRIEVVTELTRLDRDDAVVGINNYGLGGSNSFLLMRRIKKVKKNGEVFQDSCPRVVCASGRTEEAVSKLLESVNTKPVNDEYVGLLHQIFKREMVGHLYRGFAIISKHGTIRTDIERSFKKPRVLFAIFGNFNKGYKILGRYLMRFSCFKSTIEKVNDLLVKHFYGYKNIVNVRKEEKENILYSFAVQVGVVEMFKQLKLNLTVVSDDAIGRIVGSYYYETSSLKDCVRALCDMTEKSLETCLEFGFKCGKYLKEDTSWSSDFITDSGNIILNVSDRIFEGANFVSLTMDNDVTFLEVLGRLYLEGYNPHLHKIYPIVDFPVRSSTPMIAPLVEWNWHKSWYTWKYQESSQADVIQKKYEISAENKKYLLGHAVDGRNLIPATEYLILVWQTFTDFTDNDWRFEKDTQRVVFDNCEFIKAVTVPRNGYIELVVSIEKSSGSFVIADEDSVVLKGKFSLSESVIEQVDFATSERNIDVKFLEQEDVYAELNARGYNYRGLFKGMLKLSTDASSSLVRWDNNWTAFIDNMIQIKVFEYDRILVVPTSIKRIIIDPAKHLSYANQNNSLCSVYFNKQCNIIKSGGIEVIRGICAPLTRRKHRNPLLEKYVFVSNNSQTTLEASVRVVVQVILENGLENSFKAVEIVDDFKNLELLSPMISNILDDVPLVAANMRISSKMPQNVSKIPVDDSPLTSSSNILLIIATQVLQRPKLLNKILTSLGANGFILTREEVDFTPTAQNGLETILEHHVDDEKLILLRKVQATPDTKFVEIPSKNFDWIPELQIALKSDSNVVVYSQNSEPEGLLGFVNCLRREPGGNKVTCFLMLDEAPKFDEKLPFYQTQIKKQMAINIYKDKKWGTFRHLLLDKVEEVEGKDFFVRNIKKGDLSTLKWVEGCLSTDKNDNDNSISVFPFYSALNVRDVTLASGGLSFDNSINMIQQESPLGLEFSGVDAKYLYQSYQSGLLKNLEIYSKRRVMGIISNGALTTTLTADKNFLWQVPNHWSLEDASTVPLVYCTLVYALFEVIKIRPGMSILIHSATEDIGLAALNICLYHNLEIYVTVDDEKRDFIRNNFFQVPDNHIGNSRDTAFETMIKTETKGKGVDIVISSLREEELSSICCVASGGNFLEIGRTGTISASSFNLLLLERNISYHSIAFDIFFKKCDLHKWVFGKIDEGLNQGWVKPLCRTVFQRNEIVQAFECMTSGKYIGKVVVQIRDEGFKNVELFKGIPRFTADPSKSYIIVGGLGGFGLELAHWFYLRGVKKLILVSRRQTPTEYEQQKIRNWRSLGVTVQISNRDVTTKQGCLDLINDAIKLGPVDAIFNLALILKDALFENQNQETFNTALAPKAQATIYLDEITRKLCPQLNYFVAFSSVCCGRGNAGQSNYAMGNSIVERICEKRKSDGLPGLAIQWGAIGDVGFVAKMQEGTQKQILGGVIQQRISNCLEVLDRFLKQDSPVVSSMVVAEKTHVKNTNERAVDEVASILGIRDIKGVNMYTSFSQLGLDSITSTEMIQVLHRKFDISVTTNDIKNMTFSKLLEMETSQNKNRAESET